MPNPAVLLRGTALDPGLPPGTSSRVIDEVSAATQAVDAAQKEVATAYHQLFVANEAENAARLDKRFARETYDRAVKALKAAREAFDKATSTGIAHI